MYKDMMRTTHTLNKVQVLKLYLEYLKYLNFLKIL